MTHPLVLFNAIFLWLAFAFHIFLHKHVLAIEDGIGKLPYPIAENHETGLLAQHEVKLDVAMTKHEVVDVLVALHVLLGKANQEFFLLAHVWLFLAIGTFQTTVLCPIQAQSHAPSRMDGIEKTLASAVVEHRLQELKLLVRVAQSIAMRQEENLVVYLHGLWLVMHDNAALFLQVAVGPEVVVASEEMYFHTHVGQLG